MSFKLADATAAGWTLSANGEDGYAYHGSDASLRVASVTPLFSLLANIAQQIGQPFAVGYGGTEPVTAALVLACSGETLPAATPLTPAQQATLTAAANAATIGTALAARLAQIRTARTAIANGTIFASLTANEKAVIDGLLLDDIYLGRVAVNLYDGTN